MAFAAKKPSGQKGKRQEDCDEHGDEEHGTFCDFWATKRVPDDIAERQVGKIDKDAGNGMLGGRRRG